MTSKWMSGNAALWESCLSGNDRYGGSDRHRVGDRPQETPLGSSMTVHTPTDGPAGNGPVRDPADLGFAVLAALVRGTSDGIVFMDTDRRYVYANPAACELIDLPLETLVGRDYLMDVPEWNRPSALAYFESARSGNSQGGTSVICRPDGSELYLECRHMILTSGRGPLLALVFRDVSERLRQERKATALAQAAASIAMGDSLEATVQALAECALKGTRALGACVAFGGEHDRDLSVGTAGLPAGFRQAIRPASWPHAFVACQEASSTSRLVIQAQRVVVYADARRTLENDPGSAPLADLLRPLPWQAAVYAPLVYRGANVGLLIALYREGDLPYGADTTFLAALADQAAIAATHTGVVAVARRIVERQLRRR